MTNKEFWLKKWNDGETPWHLDDVHPLLSGFWHKVTRGLSINHVFVPLCGKSKDMLWFSSLGLSVFGVELSEKAVIAFFEENGLKPTKQRHGEMDRYYFRNDDGCRIDLLVGDLFNITDLPFDSQIDLVYDRAALVAINPELRDNYANKICRLTNRATQLIITVEHTIIDNKLPPFSLTFDDLRKIYGSYYTRIQQIATVSMPEGVRGNQAIECLYVLSNQ